MPEFEKRDNIVANTVRKATVTKSRPSLITEDLDQQYREAVKNKTNPDYYAGKLMEMYGGKYTGNGVKKHAMSRSASSFSVDRVFEAPHNPFRSRMAVETPSNIVENYQRFRYYAKFEPLVRTAIELHTEFPMSTFELKHEDPTLRDEFNEIADDLNLFDFMTDMVMEYYTVGESFPFGIFDDPKTPSVWKKFVLLNPLYVDISTVPITDGRPNCSYRYRVSESIKNTLELGKDDIKSHNLYNRIPKDIKDACKKGGFLDLSEIQVSHFKRKGDVFNTRGTSILHSIIHLLNYRDKLRDACYCHHPDTEVLTIQGFKRIETVTKNDLVATYDKETNLIRYDKPTNCLEFDWEGDLLHFKNRKVDLLVTPNHKMLVQTTTGNWKVKEAKDVKHTNRVKAAANWEGKEAPKTIKIGENEIPIYNFLEFAGYYVAEGFSQYTKENRTYITSVSQSIYSDHYNDFEKCFKSLPFNTHKHQSKPNKDGCIGMNFDIYGKDLVEYMSKNFGSTCFFKRIPQWIKELSREYLEILLRACCDGDGHDRGRKNNTTHTTYNSVSKLLIDDLQEIVLKCGHSSSIGSTKYKTKDGREETIYQLYFNWEDKSEKGLWLKKGEKQEEGTWSESNEDNSWVTNEYHKGKVYCLEVPTHFFVSRYKGKISIHGNSMADRHAQPRELWKIGETGLPADEGELSAFADMLSSSYNDPSQSIVWHHAVQHENISNADKFMPLRQELDAINEEIMVGLMLNKGFLDSNYGAYANMSVSLDVLISRYLFLRQRIEEWQKAHVWAPLCRIHDIYKPTQAELSHRIRVKNKEKKPWTPEIHWNKQELRDNTSKINLLMSFRDKLGKPGYPRDKFYTLVNDDPKEIKKMLAQEAKEDSINNVPQLGKGGPAAVGGGSAPLGGDLSIDTTGLGNGPSGGKADLSKVPDSQLPEFNGAGESKSLSGGEPGGPESLSIQNQNTPTS